MKLIDLLFPQNIKCVFCSKELENSSGICDECKNSLPLFSDNCCIVCGGNISGDGTICLHCKNTSYHFDRCFAVVEYRDEVKSKILSYKNGQQFLGNFISQMLWEKFQSLDIAPDIIIPMPISRQRLTERGFDQVRIMCEEIKCNYGRLNDTVLIKQKDTPHQTGLSRENRIKNLENAFKVTDKKLLKNKTVLLIDDIFTTGTTLSECSKVIRKNGATKVYCLVFARTPLKPENILN